MSIVTLANARTFEIRDAMTILDAAQAAGLALDHSCRTGRCGTCKAEVLGGLTRAVRNEESLSAGDAQAGFILTCARTADSDVRLGIEDLGALAGIKVRTLPCRIASIDKLAPDVVRVMLRLPPNNGFSALAGQYIDVIGTGGVRRSYSVANVVTDGGQVELHVRQVEGGVLSAYWFEGAKANDLLRFEGPRGTFFMRDRAGEDVVFLATGTGIAPVKAMLEDMAARAESGHLAPRSISVYWGGRVPVDLYWTPRSLSASGGLGLELNFHPVLSRADAHWTGLRGHVQDRYLDTRPDLGNTVVYACGSMAMIESAKTSLTANGLSPRRFHSDAFVSSST